MPVYLLTAHAYRSWSEDRPEGYIQRDEGRKPSSASLASHRSAIANRSHITFPLDQQKLLFTVIQNIADERQIRLHATATTLTHLHSLQSFHNPACECGASSSYCDANCPAFQYISTVFRRLKQQAGLALAKHNNTKGRPYFARGWNITPVKGRAHFDYLRTAYLPGHASDEAGLSELYP